MEQVTTIKPVQAKKIRLVLIVISLLLGAMMIFTAGFATAIAWIYGYVGNDYSTPTNIDATNENFVEIQALKPAIYLYPEKVTSVTVRLDYDGIITTDIPKYDTQVGGWNVIAEPNGNITAQDGQNYPYLFWEGSPNHPERYAHPDVGFVVAQADSEQFLRESLPRLGLIKSEYEEFIQFWLPKLERNPYNLIHFAEQSYLTEAMLTVEPKPDSVIRVFMVVRPLDRPIKIPEQQITTSSRSGFTVVEWGGTILTKQ